MTFPTELKYSKTHEWIKFEANGTASVVITDYAQQELGALVFANLPQPDDPVTAGVPFGDVESVKAVSDLVSPLTATVSEANEELLDHPDLINSDPYGSWFIKVRDITGSEDLMDAAEYEEFVKKEKMKEN